jgi:hypothetical protein
MPGTLDLVPEKLPPPPIAPRRRRMARGSRPVPIADVAIAVRTIAPSSAWTRVVPVSARTGVPLLARDRRAGEREVSIVDRAAPVLVATLAAATALLGSLLAF